MLDADSHVMELPDFLAAHADPGMRDLIPPVNFDSGGKLGKRLATYSERRRHEPPSRRRAGRARRPAAHRRQGLRGDRRVRHRPSGAKALDLLGFEQPVRVRLVQHRRRVRRPARPPTWPPARPRAHNRAMAAFCDGDERLLGVGATAIDDIDAAVAEVDHIVELGLGAVWIPHRAPAAARPATTTSTASGPRSPTPGCPSLLHVGGHPLQLDPAFMNTGRPVPGDWLGGGENVRGKDMIGLHHAGRAVRRDARARRRAGAPPRPAPRRHRARGRLGPGDAAAPRPDRRASGSRSEPDLAGADPPALAAADRAGGVHALPVRGRRGDGPRLATPTSTCSPATTRTSRAAATRWAGSRRASTGAATRSWRSSYAGNMRRLLRT